MTAIRDFFLAFFGAQRKVCYRRLLVFAAACVYLPLGYLSDQVWAAVAIVFIGGEVLHGSGLLSRILPIHATATLRAQDIVPGGASEPDAEPEP